jgi:hypothetical protein
MPASITLKTRCYEIPRSGLVQRIKCGRLHLMQETGASSSVGGAFGVIRRRYPGQPESLPLPDAAQARHPTGRAMDQEAVQEVIAPTGGMLQDLMEFGQGWCRWPRAIAATPAGSRRRA